mgnify:CR=1 FL=1
MAEATVKHDISARLPRSEAGSSSQAQVATSYTLRYLTSQSDEGEGIERWDNIARGVLPKLRFAEPLRQQVEQDRAK